MIVEAPAEFWDWLISLDQSARAGDEVALERHDLAMALLLELHDARFPPDRDHESALLRRVRHVHKHPVWRIVGQSESGAEVRFHCAFPVGTRVALITSLSGNLARIGDFFPRVVMARTELLVEHWLRERAKGVRTGQGGPCGLTQGFTSGDEPFAEALARMGAPQRILAERDRLQHHTPTRPRSRTGVRPARVPAYA